ncbi:hypothetical protein CC2G_004002 [Coprinopsis cinerea AmutBmut pab1-1]|nr:hypothetical protein CC2G_004002 [Coprinopsis cinerea AmutBmut pab1-1]
MRLSKSMGILFYLALSVAAFGWSEFNSNSDGELWDPLTIQEFTSDVLDTINKDAAQFSKSPDCFERAGTAIRFQCGRLDEPQRVAAAIAMTLCEIGTARHYSIPMECGPFTPDMLKVQRPDATIQGACVDALSRSTQLWSSYSGYMREIPQVCAAYHRLREIDIAREIYRNVTREKVALLRLLLSHEQRAENANVEWSKKHQVLEDIVLSFHRSSEALQSLPQELIQFMSNHMNTLAVDHKDALFEAIEKVQERQLEHNIELQSHLLRSIVQHEKGIDRILNSIDNAIGPQVEMSMGKFLDTWNSIVTKMEASLSPSSSLGGSIEQMTRSTEALSRKTALILSALDKTSDTIHTLEHSHVDLSNSVQSLNSLAEQLAETLEAGVQRVNASLSDLHTTPYFFSQHGTSSLPVILQRTTAILWNGKSSTAIHAPSTYGDIVLGDISFLRTGFWVGLAKFGVVTCQTIFSALTAVVFLCRLMVRGARWVLRRGTVAKDGNERALPPPMLQLTGPPRTYTLRPLAGRQHPSGSDRGGLASKTSRIPRRLLHLSC